MLRSNLTVEQKELYHYVSSLYAHQIESVLSNENPIISIMGVVEDAMYQYLDEHCSPGSTCDEIFGENTLEDVSLYILQNN